MTRSAASRWAPPPSTSCRSASALPVPAGYAGLGLRADDLRDAVRTALAPVWAGERVDEEKLLGAEFAARTLAWRAEAARTFQHDVIRAVRDEAPPGFQVLLHADPAPHHTGANPGVDPHHVLAHADGVVLPGGVGVDAFAPHTRPGTVLAANFPIVAGDGRQPPHARRRRRAGRCARGD